MRSPRGRAWVVDAGPAFGSRDMGESVVAPYLWSLGFRRIDGVVVTHPHPDHGGGVPFLLRALDVGEAWEGVAPRGDTAYAALDRALRESGVGRRAVRRGFRADWDGVEVEVIGPEGGPPPWKTRNDDSLVLVLRYGGVAFLLAGDVERAGEARLGRRQGVRGEGPAPRKPVRAARRGWWPPCGRPSPSSPPATATASAIRIRRSWRATSRRGRCVLRTDRDGSVTLSTDGRRVWVATYRDDREVRYR